MVFRRGMRRLVDPLVGTLEVQGDGFAGAGELVTLIEVEPVQRFLAMTVDEVAAASRAVREYRGAVAAAHAASPPGRPDLVRVRESTAAAARAFEALLGTDRFGRLRALSWRVRGGDALLDDDLAALLELSAPQRDALAAQAAANERESGEIAREFSRARLSSADELHDREAAADAARAGRLVDLLSPAQRRRFDALQHGTPPPDRTPGDRAAQE